MNPTTAFQSYVLFFSIQIYFNNTALKIPIE